MQDFSHTDKLSKLHSGFNWHQTATVLYTRLWCVFIMPTKKYSFYRGGQLVYVCYTKRKSDDYETDLIKRQVEYELKVEQLF